MPNTLPLRSWACRHRAHHPSSAGTRAAAARYPVVAEAVTDRIVDIERLPRLVVGALILEVEVIHDPHIGIPAGRIHVTDGIQRQDCPVIAADVGATRHRAEDAGDVGELQGNARQTRDRQGDKSTEEASMSGQCTGAREPDRAPLFLHRRMAG